MSSSSSPYASSPLITTSLPLPIPPPTTTIAPPWKVTRLHSRSSAAAMSLSLPYPSVVVTLSLLLRRSFSAWQRHSHHAHRRPPSATGLQVHSSAFPSLVQFFVCFEGFWFSGYWNFQSDNMQASNLRPLRVRDADWLEHKEVQYAFAGCNLQECVCLDTQLQNKIMKSKILWESSSIRSFKSADLVADTNFIWSNWYKTVMFREWQWRREKGKGGREIERNVAAAAGRERRPTGRGEGWEASRWKKENGHLFGVLFEFFNVWNCWFLWTVGFNWMPKIDCGRGAGDTFAVENPNC